RSLVLLEVDQTVRVVLLVAHVAHDDGYGDGRRRRADDGVGHAQTIAVVPRLGERPHGRNRAERRARELDQVLDVHEITFARVAVGVSSGAWLSRVPPQAPAKACSMAAPTRYSRSSASTGAMTCNPTGKPSSSANPHGNDAEAFPARLLGMVHRSFLYIASGSSTFSPIGKAVVGVVGDTRTSTCENAASKSRAMRVRTFCACP